MGPRYNKAKLWGSKTILTEKESLKICLTKLMLAVQGDYTKYTYNFADVARKMVMTRQ